VGTDPLNIHTNHWPTLAQFPVPAKALISCILLTMMIAMLGALGQIVIHDIIPTFFAESSTMDSAGMAMEAMPDSGSATDVTSPVKRGDLFSDDVPVTKEKAHSMPFHKTEQFVWTLKWTHIHLFGMNMIFIFMGVIAIFLDMRTRWKTLLVVLPFVGVLIDIATMWLKAFVSPDFFWLHIPGGGLFGFAFFYVSLRAFWEMWWTRRNYAVA
jgi:hypothetical protein